MENNNILPKKPEINYGQLIKNGLIKKKCNQRSLAKILNKSPSLVCDWVHNRTIPTIVDFIFLVQYFDLVEEIFPGYKKIEDIEKLSEIRMNFQDFKNILSRMANSQR